MTTINTEHEWEVLYTYIVQTCHHQTLTYLWNYNTLGKGTENLPAWPTSKDLRKQNFLEIFLGYIKNFSALISISFTSDTMFTNELFSA